MLRNQTAEGEIGIDYKTIDLILYYRFDRGFTKGQIVKKLNIDESIVDNVYERIRLNEHKRSMPPVIKLDCLRKKLYGD